MPDDNTGKKQLAAVTEGLEHINSLWAIAVITVTLMGIGWAVSAFMSGKASATELSAFKDQVREEMETQRDVTSELKSTAKANGEGLKRIEADVHGLSTEMREMFRWMRGGRAK